MNHWGAFNIWRVNMQLVKRGNVSLTADVSLAWEESSI